MRYVECRSSSYLALSALLIQEWIFRTGMKPYGWYLTLVQFAFYSVFGMVETSFKADKIRK